MTAETVLILMTLFSIKHLIVDFFLQGPYHYLNKGTYLHMGGIEHAALHGLATLGILFYMGTAALIRQPVELFLFLALADFIIHYHVDWAKMKLNAKMGWKADNSEYFWWSLGVDQFLHVMTYIWIAWVLVKGF